MNRPIKHSLSMVIVAGVCLSAWTAATHAGMEQATADYNPYVTLANALATRVREAPVNVGVGNFLYEQTEQMSAFSSLLREELEAALPRTAKFKVITRSRLGELQEAGKFQSLSICEPGTGVENVSVAGVEGIIRGRFYYKYPNVTILAELAWLSGGEIAKEKVIIPVADIGTQIWPAETPPAAAQKATDLVQPRNYQQSQENIQSAVDVESRIKDIARDFPLHLAVAEGKRDFGEGETISYRVTASEACYVAVLCHQVDGTTVVLFPNAWNRETYLPANKTVLIPGTRKSGFEIVIGPPYGTDVVQAIACTRKSHLHRTIERSARNAASERGGYSGLTRGMFLNGVETSIHDDGQAVLTDAAGPPRWGTAHIAISTYPRFGR